MATGGFESCLARQFTILHDFAAWVLPQLPDAASGRLRVGGGSVSRGRASDIFDCDVPGLVFLPGSDFDLDMTAESVLRPEQLRHLNYFSLLVALRGLAIRPHADRL